MNIDVCGRIRPSLRAEGAENLVIQGQRIAAHSTGPYLNFKTLHRQDASNIDLFHSCVDDLLDYFMAGFNVSLVIMGESGSGKTHTLSGEGSARSGIVPMIFDALFSRLQGERFMADTRVKRQNPDVSLEMYEVYNELVKDLLQVPRSGNQAAYLELASSATKGTYVKNGTSLGLRDSTEASAQFRQGLGRRTEQSTDYGPAQKNAACLTQINLSVKLFCEKLDCLNRKTQLFLQRTIIPPSNPIQQLVVGENPAENKSRFTIVEFPGLEKLADDPNTLRQREGPALSKALIALNQTVTSLSHNPYPDRVTSYSDSKLTRLLEDELGGNCKTRVILCLKPATDPSVLSSILKFTTGLAQVKNFPVVNDSYAQSLVTQYRARIIDLQQQSGVGPAPLTTSMTNSGDVRETIRSLELENLSLKDRNETLQARMDSMQGRYGNLAHTKTDLSQELLSTEEEKLKLSQTLVEMEMENNKIREESEAAKFELTNKCLMLENQMLETQNDREKNSRQARHAKDRLEEMERDRKDLAGEYVVLKTNYLGLVREHENETARNEELSIELLNLVNAKAALMKQVSILSDTDHRPGEADAEVDRVKAIVIQNSSGKVRADEILGSVKEREGVEQTLFANKKRYEDEVGRLKKEQNEETGKKDKQMAKLQKEQQDTRNMARDRQHKIAELNAAVIMLRNEKDSLGTQNNRLQHKVKDIGEDFRTRLIKYIEDISHYMEEGGGVPDGKRDKRLKQYVDTMFRDITLSHKEREEQLSAAAQQYREGRRHYAHKYEELLIAYRNLRLSSEARGLDPEDMGPDEHELSLTDVELKSQHLKEINRLKTELGKMKGENGVLRERFGLTEDLQQLNLKPGEKPAETWAALRKQLREFTLNTQKQLEDERTRLLSENEVLQEQNQESQIYIDNHLARYKEEIVKLRGQLGYDENGHIPTERSEGKRRYKKH